MKKIRPALHWLGKFLQEQRLPLAFLLFVLINATYAYWVLFSPRPLAIAPTTVTDTWVEVPPAGMVTSPLTGEYVSEALSKTPPLAVMIDNFTPGARPPAGFSKAAVVFETLVEGGVTRYMAVFQTDEDVEIGPVRSARSYYLPWANELGAVYAHSGGSVDALNALRQNAVVFDADEFRYGGSFFRRGGISAPHDLFTSTKRLVDLAILHEVPAPTTSTGWAFTKGEITGAPARAVTINFSLPPYKVRWIYDEEKKLYRRVLGGAIAEDRNTREQLTTKNIIVLEANVRPAPPPAKADAVIVETIGEGAAWIIRQGVVTKGAWKKENASARLQFVNERGEVVPLTPGQSWIEVIGKEKFDDAAIEP